jgi:hypothetical protein
VVDLDQEPGTFRDRFGPTHPVGLLPPQWTQVGTMCWPGWPYQPYGSRFESENPTNQIASRMGSTMLPPQGTLRHCEIVHAGLPAHPKGVSFLLVSTPADYGTKGAGACHNDIIAIPDRAISSKCATVVALVHEGGCSGPVGMVVRVGSPSFLCEQIGMTGFAMVRAVAYGADSACGVAVWRWSVQVAHNAHYQHHQAGQAQYGRVVGRGVCDAETQ